MMTALNGTRAIFSKISWSFYFNPSDNCNDIKVIMKARVNPFRQHNYNQMEKRLCLPNDGWSFPRENPSYVTKRI